MHCEVPVLLLEDIQKLRKPSVNTKQLCSSNKGLKHFFSVESASAPCLTRGTSKFWLSVDNHNDGTCERYTDKMGLVLTLDRRVRGYILNMITDLE